MMIDDALAQVLDRIDRLAEDQLDGFPHWADPETGVWITTPDGDWTGGAWPGQLWLAAGPGSRPARLAAARRWSGRLAPRVSRRTVFKGFGFYYGAAVGAVLHGDSDAADLAKRCADSLVELYDPALGLIPLGSEAEESHVVDDRVASIDSLQATPLLLWAWRHTGNQHYRTVARNHTSRVLALHRRHDDSIVQSTRLDGAGNVIEHFTHKGINDDSTWGRAQAWALLHAALGAALDGESPAWVQTGEALATWWLERVPSHGVAPWDFDDPAGDRATRDTSATAIAACGLLKLAALVPDPTGDRWRKAAARSVATLVEHHLSSESSPAGSGRLVDGCFNRRPESRRHDRVDRAELIFGSYYLCEALLVLSGRLDPLMI